MSEVNVAADGGTGIVTIDRPQVMNALSLTVRRGLVAAIRQLEGDERIRVIVLTACGQRAFCAGLDLGELATTPGVLSEENQNDAAFDPVLALLSCAKPTIAAVNGVAITGGLELAMSCDMILASDTARFADTHGKVGVLPGWGLSQKLARTVGLARAKEMSFSGRFVDARTALDWGLVNRVVPPDRLLSDVLELAAQIARTPADYLRQYKALMDDGYAGTLAEGLDLEAHRAHAHNAALKPISLDLRRGDR